VLPPSGARKPDLVAKVGSFSPSSFQPGKVRWAVPENRLKRGLRATFIGLATNTVLTTAKLIAGIVGHSHALVADAVESLADIFS